MKWANLKENLCPNCNKDIMQGAERQILRTTEKMLVHPCGFKIRENKIALIVSSQINQELEDALTKEYERQ